MKTFDEYIDFLKNLTPNQFEDNIFGTNSKIFDMIDDSLIVQSFSGGTVVSIAFGYKKDKNLRSSNEGEVPYSTFIFVLHNEDGPAILSKDKKHYFLHGKMCNESDIEKMKLKKKVEKL